MKRNEKLESYINKKITKENLKEMDNIIIEHIGNDIDKKIIYISEYMNVINIVQSGSVGNIEDKINTFEVLCETFIDGDWRYLNGK